jgi:dihydrofolate reductase
VADLIYSAIASLDGYVADENGNFDWAAPDEEVHGFVNDLERPIGTYLYGRRMYETMEVWEDPATVAGEGAAMQDYARIWQAADKVVYSTTLDEVRTARTRLEREFDPQAVRAMKNAAASDISVGGSHLAAEAIRAGLVDEIHLFLGPVVIGRGTRALPEDVRISLELRSERRFAGGTVYVSYRVREGA